MSADLSGFYHYENGRLAFEADERRRAEEDAAWDELDRQRRARLYRIELDLAWAELHNLEVAA